MLTPAQFRRAVELFGDVRSKSREDRMQILDALAAEDQAIAAEVRRLLQNDAEKTTFLEDPLEIADPELLAGDIPPEEIESSLQESLADFEASPIRIGRHEVIARIGAGGMGVVYEVRQDNPERTVAVKLIRAGLASHAMMRRFSREAQVLARLTHPGITHVYDAGVAPVSFENGTSASLPFIAMEFVRGQSLRDYADDQPLSMRDRMALMANVCDAVHHAHQKGVIHRDLKPGNILIDETGQPKITDFGVARATDADVHTATLQTEAGQLIGTVSYMSPEQLSGDPEDLDIRSDVYSLGVVLYELLCGRLPHEVQGQAIPSAVRTIQETEATRLSRVNAGLRGDVETIVHKALERDKSRRYQSAAQLAADIRRYLGDEPILVRPSSGIYQLRKFAKRNKALVSGVAIALMALLAGTGVSIRQAVRATKAETHAKEQQALAQRRAEDAEAARQDTEAAIELLTDLLMSPDPTKLGREVRMTDVLELASERFGESWTDRPLIEAHVRDTIGRVYASLGDYAQAASQLERTWTIRKEHLGADEPLTISTARELVWNYGRLGRVEEGERLILQVIDALQRVNGEDHPDTMVALSTAGTIAVHAGDYRKAERYFRMAMTGLRRTLGDDHADTLTAVRNIGHALARQSRFAEAEPFLIEALDGYRRLEGEDHPSTLSALNDVGIMFMAQAKPEEAEPYFQKAWSLKREVLGPDHDSTLTSQRNLGSAMLLLGEWNDAENTFRDVLERLSRTVGETHTSTLSASRAVGMLLMRRDQLTEAEPLIRDTLAKYKSALGPSHPETLKTVSALGKLRFDQGNDLEAERLLRESMVGLHDVLGAKHRHTLAAMTQLGRVLMDQGRVDEARPLVTEALAIQTKNLGRRHPDVVRTLALLAHVHELGGDHESAEKAYHDATDIAQQTLLPDHPSLAELRLQRGTFLLRRGRIDDAREMLLAAHTVFETKLGRSHRNSRKTIEALAECHERLAEDEAANRYRAMLEPRYTP